MDMARWHASQLVLAHISLELQRLASMDGRVQGEKTRPYLWNGHRCTIHILQWSKGGHATYCGTRSLVSWMGSALAPAVCIGFLDPMRRT